MSERDPDRAEHHLKLENLRDAVAAEKHIRESRMRPKSPYWSRSYTDACTWVEDAALATVESAIAAKLIKAEPGESYERFMAQRRRR